MKWFFLFLLSLFFAFCVVRFAYGLESNSVAYMIEKLLSVVPDVRADFQVFVDACKSFRNVILSFEDLLSDFSFLDALLLVARIMLAFVNVIVSLATAIAYFLGDIVEFLEAIIDLAFGDVVVPIAPIV